MFKRLAILRTHEVFVNRLARTRGHQDLVWPHTALPKMGRDNMILISYPDTPTANGHASVVCQSDSSRKTNSLVAAIRRYSFSNAYQWYIGDAFLVKFLVGECQKTFIATSQHWFSLHAVRQQSITWTNVDQILANDVTSLIPNDLTEPNTYARYGTWVKNC